MKKKNRKIIKWKSRFFLFFLNSTLWLYEFYFHYNFYVCVFVRDCIISKFLSPFIIFHFSSLACLFLLISFSFSQKKKKKISRKYDILTLQLCAFGTLTFSIYVLSLFISHPHPHLINNNYNNKNSNNRNLRVDINVRYCQMMAQVMRMVEWCKDWEMRNESDANGGCAAEGMKIVSRRGSFGIKIFVTDWK